jgi:uncharacterized protein (TIGR02646 family)
MKYIIKCQEPPLFSIWKGSATEDWNPTYDDLQGEENRELVDALIKEQGYICCYCESRLIVDESHIEHFKPQCDKDVDPLDYSNMLRSCQNILKQGDPRHCGHLKGNWFDSQLLISPLDPTCEGRFSYTIDGTIYPSNESDIAAIKTIEKLGLNIPKLKALRRNVIEPFLNLDNELDGQELFLFVTKYLEKNDQGKFGEFWTTINYLFGM